MAGSPLAVWRDVCLSPSAWFATVRERPRVLHAMTFALCCELVGALGHVVEAKLSSAPVPWIHFLTFPISTLFGLGTGALFVHGMLTVVRARNASLAATFAVGAWASAPAAVGVIPYVGGLVGGVWGVVLWVIGLAVVHQTTKWRVGLSVASAAVLPVAAALGVRAFVVEAFKIPSASMQPTLLVGDHLFVDKLAYRSRSPRPGEVIVFDFPENREQAFIKRVVAVGGDTVVVDKGHVVVNGRRAPTCRAGVHVERGEQTVRQSVEVEMLDGQRYITLHDQDGYHSEFGPFVVPSGQLFVMGDNRDNAHDSRGWFDGKGGGVPLDHVKGRAWVFWLSLAEGGQRRTGRVGHEVHGVPLVPEHFEAEVAAGVQRCLSAEGVFEPR